MRSPRTLERSRQTVGGGAAEVREPDHRAADPEAVRSPRNGNARPNAPAGVALASVLGLAAALAIGFPFAPGYSLRDAAADVIAAVVVAVVAVGSVPLAAWLAGRSTPEWRSLARQARFAAALMSAGAATVHLVVVKMHVEEYLLFGLFFAGVGIAQLAWAVWLLVRPSRSLLMVGAVANASIAALWGVDRIWGLPLGPDRWTPEPVGFGDTVTSAFELMLALCCIGLLAPAARRALQQRRGPAAGQAALALSVVALTVLSLLSVAGVAPSVLPPTQ